VAARAERLLPTGAWRGILIHYLNQEYAMKLPGFVLAMIFLTACHAAPAFDGEPYGEPLTLRTVTPISEIVAAPRQYIGQRVLIEGTVADVCDKKGCWMDIVAGDAEIQVKVEDDVIVFPVSARGSTALVEGMVEERNLTAEEAFAAAAHRAEEQGLPFDSTAVYEATTIYRIRGIGALIRG
jgi:hypothetical protein